MHQGQALELLFQNEFLLARTPDHVLCSTPDLIVVVDLETAEPITAETAESWGLIWKVVADAVLMEQAGAMAAHLATQPTAAFALIKDALNIGGTNDLSTQLDLERDLQRKAGLSPDYKEGVAAFMEKRPAKFTGRAS